jgi:hypothetical protein
MNTNFTDIINSLTNGLDDLTINDLTANGTLGVTGAATFDGAVTLGNATSDDITITGYVASDILPKTTQNNILGSSAQSWRSVSVDNGATDGGAIYFNSSSSVFLKSDASGADLDMGGFTGLDLTGAMIKTNAVYHEAKSATYTITDTDGVGVVLVTTSTTDRTVTLPTAADNSGRIIQVKKVDSATGKVTIDGEGSETIDGQTTYDLLYDNESMTLICDGTEWHILNDGRYYDSGELTLPSLTFDGTTPPTLSNNTYRWVRNKANVYVEWTWTGSSSSADHRATYWVKPSTMPTPYKPSWLSTGHWGPGAAGQHRTALTGFLNGSDGGGSALYITGGAYRFYTITGTNQSGNTGFGSMTYMTED